MRRYWILIVWSLLLFFGVGCMAYALMPHWNDRAAYEDEVRRQKVARKLIIKKDCTIQYPRSYERYRECVDRGMKSYDY